MPFSQSLDWEAVAHVQGFGLKVIAPFLILRF